MTGTPDLIDRAALRDKIDALIVAASRQWGVGSAEHNLVRDIGDVVARVPAVAYHAALPAIDSEGLVERLLAMGATPWFKGGSVDMITREAADTITRLSHEVEEAREAIERVRNVIAFGYPRDGINPLRNGDTCSHGRLGHEDCIGCYDEALLAAMDEPPKDDTP